jgi:phosphoglycolate phosphatase
MTTPASPIKAVIFDLDGTIVRLPINWSQLKQELIQAKLLGKNQSLTDGINDTKAAANLPNLKQLLTAIRHYESPAIDHFSINQAIYHWIHVHCHHYLLSVCSSNLHATIEAVLKQLNIYQHFHQIIGNEDVKKLKPDPEGINQIITRLRLTTAQTAFVGDQPTDLQTAARTGVKYYSPNQLTQLLP